MKRLNILIAIMMLAAFALAQDVGGGKGTSTKNVQKLGRAPVNNQPLEISLHKPVQRKLKNGLTLLLIERHKLPTINNQKCGRRFTATAATNPSMRRHGPTRFTRTNASGYLRGQFSTRRTSQTTRFSRNNIKDIRYSNFRFS